MNIEFFKSILLKKWEQKKLGHFYILRGQNQTNSPENPLNIFIFEFFKIILLKENRTPPATLSELIMLDHPDILFLEPTNSIYQVDDFKSFFKTLSFNNFELSWRFIVVSDAHLIKENIISKLLKSLEEPPPQTTIFFLNPTEKYLLPTIESRAIKFKIGGQSFEDTHVLVKANQALEYLKHKYLGDPSFLEITTLLINYLNEELSEITFIEHFKTKNLSQENFLHLCADLLCILDTDYSLKQKALEEIQWFVDSNRYNLIKEDRLLGMLCCVSKSFNNAKLSIDTP